MDGLNFFKMSEEKRGKERLIDEYRQPTNLMENTTSTFKNPSLCCFAIEKKNDGVAGKGFIHENKLTW